MGIRVHGHAPDVTEVELAHKGLAVGVELVDLQEVAVHEQRDRVDHGVDAVLQHAGALLGFTAVDVHDVDRFHHVQQLVGAQSHEHIGDAW